MLDLIKFGGDIMLAGAGATIIGFAVLEAGVFTQGNPGVSVKMTVIGGVSMAVTYFMFK
jgi:hypothetical protein